MFELSEENEKLFYHEYDPHRRHWIGNYRGIPFEIKRVEWAKRVRRIGTSLPTLWTHYIYLNLDYIPDKYDQESFWIEPILLEMPEIPLGDEPDPLLQNMNTLSREMNERSRRDDRRVYRADEHPILGELAFHGGLTYYEREYEKQYRLVKVGCDYSHHCDMMPELGSWHENPVTLDFVVNQVRETIDSVYQLMPEYAAEGSR